MRVLLYFSIVLLLSGCSLLHTEDVTYIRILNTSLDGAEYTVYDPNGQILKVFKLRKVEAENSKFLKFLEILL